MAGPLTPGEKPEMSDEDGAPAASGRQVRVNDTVVARVAAHCARQVPGVAGLRPDLAQSMLGIASRFFEYRDRERRIPTDGVTVTIEDGHASIAITLVTRFDHNCRDVAQAVQDRVSDAVRAYTGLTATVAVTVAEVELGA